MTTRIALVRHGQSQANADGLFTGITDSPLTTGGREEARRAAHLLDETGFRPASILCSPLARATETARIMVSENQWTVPATVDVRLRERDHGDLTGRTKADVRRSAGEEDFTLWRRSLDIPPPPSSDAQFAKLWAQDALRQVDPSNRTRAESLLDVIVRVRPVAEAVKAGAPGGTVLVVGHGNSLRALCLVLDALTPLEVAALNIPTGHPLIYDLASDGHPLTRGGTYLDPAAAALAAAVITREGGT